MAKITSLTPGQEKRLAQAYEEWLAVGRSTANLDRSAAENVVIELYARIGKPKPLVLFFSSPMMCMLARGWLLGLSDQLSAQLSAQLRAQLSAQLSAHLRAQLRAQLSAQLAQLAQLSAQLSAQLRAQLSAQLAQLSAQLRAQLSAQLSAQLDQLSDQLSDQLDQLSDQRFWWAYFSGQHWCGWEAFWAFCREIGVRYTAEQSAHLDLWMRQAKELHWWFPYEGIVLVSERHTSLHVDDRGRLHHPTELACGYSDGWGIHAWHGTRIPETYFQREAAGPEILAERNAEVRRALIERYDELNGKGSFMRACGARVLDSAVQPMHIGGKPMLNELLAIELPEDPEERMVALRVICPSTAREYIIRVPPQMKSVSQALAWTFDVKPSEYVLAQET